MNKIWAFINKAGLLGLILLGVSATAQAQTAGLGIWPTQKPIRLIAVFPPGGSVDQVARILAQALQATKTPTKGVSKSNPTNVLRFIKRSF